jgi:hypothetical protein
LECGNLEDQEENARLTLKMILCIWIARVDGIGSETCEIAGFDISRSLGVQLLESCGGWKLK